jgi:metal-dependent amidase/aminoacylase/carboxypeptidase family protein
VVSHEKYPVEFGVVPIGAVQAGTVEYIIPDTATLRGTIRSYNPEVCDKLLGGVRRTADVAAMMAGAARQDVALVEGGVAVINSEAVVTRTETVLKDAFGSENVKRAAPMTASEDFSAFIDEGVPSMLFFVGIYDPRKTAESKNPGGRPFPFNHSPLFAPVPSIKTSVPAMSLAVLTVLRPR